MNSILIYWGSPLIHLDFNTKSLINHHDYNSDQEVIARIIELDQGKYKMADIMKETWFSNNVLNTYCNKETLRFFFVKYLVNRLFLFPLLYWGNTTYTNLNHE